MNTLALFVWTLDSIMAVGWMAIMLIIAAIYGLILLWDHLLLFWKQIWRR